MGIAGYVSLRLMPRQLDEYASYMLKQSIEAQGVEVMLNTQIKELLGEGQVQGFVTESGRQGTCDMVMFSTGIVPNIQIAHNTELKVNKGIVINNRMETNIKDIFAAGDISEFNGKVYGLWGMAMQQGKIAGANICNMNLIFEPSAPVTSLDAFGVSVFSLGNIEEAQDTNSLVEIRDDENKYYRVFIRNNHIVGTIILGDTKKFMALKSLIEKKLEVNFVNPSNYSIDELIEMLTNRNK
jgi:nitrite reductase (NADH) large subunit